MNYEYHYYRLIETRKILNRKKNNDGFLEKHHVIPKSLGGDNTKTNIVLLTPREHFVAHWLLYKMHTGMNKAKMAYAFFRMCSNNLNQKRDITATQFVIARNAMTFCKGKNNPNRGKRLWTDEQRKQISERQKGKNNSMYGKDPWNKGLIGVTIPWNKGLIGLPGTPHTDEAKKKISESHKGKHKSKEHKEKLRLANLGKTRSLESISKTADALRGKSHNIVSCPHCGKTGGYSAMHRWHFNNCKDI